LPLEDNKIHVWFCKAGLYGWRKIGHFRDG
jgi:hypothetical protein